MSQDDETMRAYAKAADDYARGFAHSSNTDQEEDHAAFVALLPAGGRILDLGCGPGHWAARFAAEGFSVEATDASREMARHAAAAYGLEVAVGPFEDLVAEARYDGVWANFSLLHAPRRAFPGHLRRIRRAMRAHGALSLGMKLGEGEGRDSLGRFYAYYSEAELRDALEQAGFTVLRTRRGNGRGLAGAEETFVVLTGRA
ncbi:MAG: class I SAM-dependent methyltransferase [Rhodosalinus sp.]